MTSTFDDLSKSHVGPKGQNSKGSYAFGESNTSIDSGMEDSINQPDPDPEDHDDVDDEDEVVVSHKKRTNRMVIEDDDEDDDVDGKEETVQEQATSPAPSDSIRSSVVTNNSDSSDDEDPKLEFDDLDVDEEESKSVGDGEILEEAKQISTENESQGSDESDEEPGPLTIHLKNRELFDAESDEENRPVEQSNEEQEEEKEEHNSEEDHEGQLDEGFDESQVDPKLLAKLKKMKGASKTDKQREKHSRKAKPTADQMSDLYSESQRMLRDSRVNIPYYEPEAKSLDDFLARASQKRQEYSSLHRPKDIQKALIIHERLSVKLPKRISHSYSKSKNEHSETDNNINSPVLLGSQAKDMDEPMSMCQDSGVDSQNIEASQSSTLILESNELSQSEECADSQPANEDDTDLPDLEPVYVTDASLVEARNDTDSIVDNSQSKTIINNSFIEFSEDNCTIQRESDEKTKETSSQDLYSHPDLVRDPSLDLFGSLSAEEHFDSESVHLKEFGEDVTFAVKTVPSSQSLKLSDSHTECSGTQFLEAEICDNQLDSQLENSSKSTKKGNNKLALLEKLRLQGSSLPSMPKLSGSPDSMIMLESDKSSETPRNSGVQKLMDRLIKHSAKRKPKPAYDVNFSIVEKESEDGQNKELKLKSLTYHVEEEKEELPSTAPGSNLLLLKEALGKGMRIKREEARLRKQQLYNMENEEGYGQKDDDNEADEEAEMTDEPDTDEEEEDEDEEDPMQLMMDDDDDDGRDYNPLLDTEAREEDDDEVNGYSSFDEESNDAPLRLELSEDDEEDGEDDVDEDDNNKNYDGDKTDDEDDNDSVITNAKRAKKYNKSQVLLSDSEEEEEISNILNNKEKNKTSSVDDGKDTGFTLDDSWRDELAQKSLSIQNNHRGIYRENSQSPELYGPSTLDESESSSTRHTDNFNDSVCSFNPHSQMLDADGYLKIAQTQKPRSRIGMLVNETQDESTALDIFGKVSAKKIFGGASGQSNFQEDNLDELMGLCSGKFQTNPDSDDELNPSQNRQPSKQTGFGEGLHDDSDPFHILSDDEDIEKSRHKRIKPVLSDSDDREESNSKDPSDKKYDHSSKQFAGLFDKKQKRLRREFFEDEAELSGSEFDSDENLDLAEEDDILEEEEGDRDMAGVSNELLRDQVGRVHMKQLQDEDDREVMRFKEMYLQDGDLHGDGGGRIRNFKWKDIDESSQQDMFGQASDEEVEDEDKEDLKWRKERYEREKFLQESEQGTSGNEGSQLVKLGQLFLKKQDSSCSERPEDQLQVLDKSKKSLSRSQSRKLKGSFLARGKEALGKIAQVAKTVLGGNSNKNSRTFLFQSVESQSNQEDQEESILKPAEPAKRKAHTNAPNVPAAKKPRLVKNATQERPTVKRHSSIFNLLDK